MNVPQILNDFRRRYEHSYIWVEFPDGTSNIKEALFYVNAIEQDETYVGVIHLSSDELGSLRLNYGTNHSLKFKYPPVGVFQSGRNACIFRRRPARQYRRGLCSDNSRISYVSSVLSRRTTATFCFETVSDAFKHVTFTVAQAIAMLRAGTYQSVALRDNFSLVNSVDSTGRLWLFHWGAPIASFHPETSEIVTLEPSYEIQIGHLFHDYNRK